MMVGLACFALGMWNFAPITHEWGWRELLLPQAFRGFAQLFAVAPTVTLTLGGLAPERLKLASGLFNLMRNLGGAIGIAACGTILNDRANLHFLRLAEHLNATNSAMLDLLQEEIPGPLTMSSTGSRLSALPAAYQVGKARISCPLCDCASAAIVSRFLSPCEVM
jgi:hypothetical protein